MFIQFKASVEEIAEKKVPLVLCLADNDSVMNKKMNATFVKACGASVEDATIYGKDGKLERLGPLNERLTLLRTRGGGHFSFIRMSDSVNQAAFAQLEKVLKKEDDVFNLEQKLQMDIQAESATVETLSGPWQKGREAQLVL